MRRLSQSLLALFLVLAWICPVSAAGSTVLLMQENGSAGEVWLSLQNMGNQQISSVQLELTLSGSYPRASFAMPGAPADQYGFCRVETSRNETYLTLYVDSVQGLDRNGTVSLGTLSLGKGYTAPASARLTVLDRDLEPGRSTTISVRSTAGGGSSIPEVPEGYYAIRTASTGRGTVIVSRSSAERGETVTVTVRPDSGYELLELTASTGSRRLQLTGAGGGSFTFVMPAEDVEVRGVFSAAAQSKPFPFTDVPGGIWFREAVEYAYETGLMSGVTDTSFSPDLPTSRGMIVTILYRLAGSPAAGTSGFTDVAAGQYYAKAVAWASANGVVNGYGDGRFGPDNPITREQMAVILRGYAQLQGRDVTARADLSGYRDAGQISAYARDAVAWASARGLINGTTTTTLTPGGTATRAQAAVILKGFCENVLYLS